MPVETRRIILDCDPGHDDAVAILLAAGNPTIDLVGVTTVGGNQTLEKVTRNAAVMMTIAGLVDVPLYAGCARPLIREPRTAGDVHGDSGMDITGVELPEPGVEVADGHAVDFIIDTVMGNPPDTITLVPTGPLTNIALAVRREPRIAERVREVVFMDGAIGAGNATPTAEFNVLVDPEAAHIVLGENWPVVMVGLDLTHQALATAEVQARFAELGSFPGDVVVGLIDFFRAAYRDNQGFTDPPVHDPCTIAYLIDDTVVETIPAPLTVELHGEQTTGMTVVDRRQPAAADCHQSVATRLDHGRFWELVLAAVGKLG